MGSEPPPAPPLPLLTAALTATYDRVTEAVGDLPEPSYELPTRTDWTVAELLFHQLLDAQRALAALVTTTSEPTDVDAVTYWRPFRPTEGDGGVGHARFVRRSAAAFDAPEGLVGWWRVFARAVPRAVELVGPDVHVETQGHVIAVPDLVSTLLVEATVHYLDLTVSLPDAPPPLDEGLAETLRVLEGLAGGPLRAPDGSVDAILRSTGRLPGAPVLLG